MIVKFETEFYILYFFNNVYNYPAEEIFDIKQYSIINKNWSLKRVFKN